MNNVTAVGVPVIKEEILGECCPDCGCKKIFVVQVKSKDENNRMYYSTYGGCAGCGWKSHAILAADIQPVLPNV